jgi:PAS domain S-box-containing protein
MQNAKIEYVLYRLNKELHRFIDTIGEIPYVALPSEKPEIICFAGKIKELTGYDANEILADREHWENMISPEDRKQVFAAFARCKNEGMPFNIEYRIVHKDGSLRYVLDKGEPVFDNKGEITQVEGVITPLGEGTKPESIPLLEIKEVPMFNNVHSTDFQRV